MLNTWRFSIVIHIPKEKRIIMEDPYFGSPISYVERENPKDSSYLIASKEQVEFVERSLKEPLDKRRYTWCLDTIRGRK